MAQLSKIELDEVFVDVRKAYRLLYLYQRRILDTIKFISNTLNKSVVGGYPLYGGNTPRSGGKISLDALAWDWLVMFGYEFYFQDETINGDNYQFAISIQSDSGYDDAEAGVTLSMLERFLPVEESATRIYFYIGKNMWKQDVFDSAWASDSHDEFEHKEDVNKTFLSKRFDLSDFRDEDSITECLQKVREYFRSKGIKLF